MSKVAKNDRRRLRGETRLLHLGFQRLAGPERSASGFDVKDFALAEPLGSSSVLSRRRKARGPSRDPSGYEVLSVFRKRRTSRFRIDFLFIINWFVG